MKNKETHSLIGDELLVIIFNKFPKEINLFFKKDIMLAFYKISKKPMYIEFFKNYKFNEDTATPYSREITEGIFDLENNHLIYKKVGDNYWQISKGIEIRFNQYIKPKLNEGQKKLLEKLSNEIKKFLL